MSAVDTKFYEKKKWSTFYGAIVFLICIVAWTWALYFYWDSIAQANEDLNRTLTQIDNSISELQENPGVQIYSIYSQNKVFLNRLSESSDIPSHIAHLRKNIAIHDVSAKWYNYSDGIATLELSAETDENWYAYQKVVDFLTAYRSLDEEAIFNIESISNFTWYDRITFSAEFTLK